MKNVARIAIVAVLVIAAGCSQWRYVKQADGMAVDTERYSFRVPANWSVHVLRGPDRLRLTRDGPSIQQVRAQWAEWDKSIPGDPAREKLERSMLPADAAEQLFAAFQRERGLDVFEVVSIEPATFAGGDAFRAEFTYRTSKGLRYRGIWYGSMRPQGVYMVVFEAPELHYFERDQSAFETIVRSVRRI